MRVWLCGHVRCRLSKRLNKMEIRLVPYPLILQELLRHWANCHPPGSWAGWALLTAPVPWASLCCKLPTRYSKFDNYGRRNKPEHSSTITDANLAMHLLIPSLMIAWLQYALHQPRLYKPKQLFCCRIGRLRLRHPYETRHGGFLQFLGYCSASLARCKDIHSPIVCFR